MSKASGQTPWRRERRIAAGKQNGHKYRSDGRLVGSDDHVQGSTAIDWDKHAENMKKRAAARKRSEEIREAKKSGLSY